MNRIVKGFILAPLLFSLALSVQISLFSGGGPGVFFYGFLLYAGVSYLFTVMIALPLFIVFKKFNGGKNPSYLVTSVAGVAIGALVGLALSSAYGAYASLVLGLFGLLLSNLFWFIAIREQPNP